jgi:heme/copper-type cytochrome/quinol oxidase subunit 2
MKSISRGQFIAGLVIGCLVIALLFSGSIFYFAWLCRQQNRAKSDNLLQSNKQTSSKSQQLQLLLYATPVG